MSSQIFKIFLYILMLIIFTLNMFLFIGGWIRQKSLKKHPQFKKELIHYPLKSWNKAPKSDTSSFITSS
ncbi:hypothetical protein EBS43_08550 [bacterium]|nr:hypothetical protein [bacterium]